MRRATALLLLLIAGQRLWLALAQPDLVHDLDAAELKLLDLATAGLPGAGTLIERIRAWAGGPENVHQGGYVVVSCLEWGLSRLLGTSLFVLRLLPIAAATGAAAALAALLRRRVGERAALVALALFAGAPPLLLKWTTTARGGHSEAILLPILLALLLDRALVSGKGRSWALAGLLGGFSLYFSYLCAPAVALLSVGALVEARREPGWGRAAGALAGGALLGFTPWLFGLVVLELPYFAASIHMTSNPDEAREVFERTLLGTLRATWAGLPHNLWPWGVHASNQAAYASPTPDVLGFEVGLGTWAARGIVSLAVLAGILRAFRHRSGLLVALCLLPAAQHLFVLRAANTLGWPVVPHRYLVLAFPAVVAAAALGATWEGRGRRAGELLAGALSLVALGGLLAQAQWLGPVRWEQFGAWDVAAFRAANVGQVRIDEGRAVGELLAVQGETAGEERRGVALVFPQMSDYYLLFRARPDDRPYPDALFSREDPLSVNEEQRRAVARGALEATRVRSRSPAELRERICSWRPEPVQRPAVLAVLAEAGIEAGCLEGI